MTISDKFTSDCARIKKTERAGTGNTYNEETAAKTCEKIISLFECSAPKYGHLAQELGRYWQDAYVSRSATPSAEPTDEHINKLASFLSFLLCDEGAFDFISDDDWREITDCVNDEAESLPIETLTQMMKIIMEKMPL